ncbi:MAG: hypothetical protein KDK89_14735 [Alphaproteobacteria bacterium]|nr:hypothetical protein [Alphaproteobacteria bacterium]
MIAKSLIAAAAVASTMALAAPVQQAQAGVDIDVNIGGGWYPGYGYGYDYDYGYYPKKNFVSCHKGKKIVRWSGFHNVHAVDCSLPGYKYTGWKFGKKYIVRVNRYGNITGVHKI